jgi:aminopeptidase N
VHDIEWVTVHEFAHQYFYGLFASSEWSWPFLDEGLAEYATGRVLTDLFGRDRELFDGMGLSFGYRAFEGGPAAATDDRIPVASRSDAFPSYLSYGEHVYRRTAAILESAEDVFGADRVDRALRAYAGRVRFAHPVPRDLFDAMRETDAEMGSFVEAAITGSPELNDRITAVARASNTTQVSLGHRGPLRLPRTVEVTFADGSTRRTRVTDTTAPLRFESTAAPIAARIDPEHALAIDRNRLDDARAADRSATSSDLGTTARLAFWIEALLRGVGL